MEQNIRKVAAIDDLVDCPVCGQPYEHVGGMSSSQGPDPETGEMVRTVWWISKSCHVCDSIVDRHLIGFEADGESLVTEEVSEGKIVGILRKRFQDQATAAEWERRLTPFGAHR